MGKPIAAQPPAPQPHPAYGNGGYYRDHVPPVRPNRPTQKPVVERHNRHVPIIPRKPDQADE